MARTMTSDVPRPHYPCEERKEGLSETTALLVGPEVGPIEEGPTAQAPKCCLCLVFPLERGNVR